MHATYLIFLFVSNQGPEKWKFWRIKRANPNNKIRRRNTF